MFVYSENWINSIVVFKCIFDETFSLFDENSEFIWNCDSGLLKSSRQKTDVSSFTEKIFD